MVGVRSSTRGGSSNDSNQLRYVVGEEAKLLHGQTEELLHEVRSQCSTHAQADSAWITKDLKRRKKDVVLATSKVGTMNRVKATIKSAPLTLLETRQAISFLHSPAHFLHLMQYAFPLVEQAKLFAKVNGDGYVIDRDATIGHLTWSVPPGGRAVGKENVILQRSGRVRSPEDGSESVYHALRTINHVDQVPSLGITQDPSSLGSIPFLALIIRHGQAAGSLDVILQWRGVPDDRIQPVIAIEALRTFIVEVVQVHRQLGLTLPETSLTFISPFSKTHKTLIRLPDSALGSTLLTPSSSSKSMRLTSMRLTSSESYRVVCIRFISSTSGSFSVQGMDPADVEMMPPLARKGVDPPQGFRFTTFPETVRLFVSTQTKDLTLFWNHLRKGGLHYYLVDVHSVRRPVMGPTLGLLEDMAVVEDVQRRIGDGSRRSTLVPATKVVVLREAKQVEERSLYFSCKMREGVERSSLAGGLLQTTYRDWVPLRAIFDLMWPYVLFIPFPVVFVAFQELTKTDPMLIFITSRFLISALTSMIFAQTVSLHKSCFYLTHELMKIGRFEWSAFHSRRLRHLLPFVLHFIHAVVGTILLALWAELQTLRGGTTISKLVLVYCGLEEQLEARVLLVIAVTTWAFLLSFTLSSLHWVFGDNQELCLDTVLWMSRQGIIQPRRMPPTRILVPLKSAARPTSSAHARLAGTAALSSTTNSLDETDLSSSVRSVAVVQAVMVGGKSVEAATTVGTPATTATTPSPATTTTLCTPRTESLPQSLDRPIRKEGPVSQLRWTGTVMRKQKIKEVWLVVDASHVTIYKGRDRDPQGGHNEEDASTSPAIHYTFPLADLTSSRHTPQGSLANEPTELHYGFRIACGKETVDLLVPSEEVADKWLSCINWNQLVLTRKQQWEGGNNT